MEQIIAYGDEYGNEISQQQFEMLKDYSILYKQDNAIKRIEYYRNKEISSYGYYLDNGELLSSVVEMYKNAFIEIINRSVVGDYVITESCVYDNGVLKLRLKLLYDSFGSELCEQHCELTTGEPILQKTEKYLFNDTNGDSILSFDYNESGTVRSIWGDLVDNTDQGRKGSIYGEQILVYFPDLFKDHPYYANADLMPTGAISNWVVKDAPGNRKSIIGTLFNKLKLLIFK